MKTVFVTGVNGLLGTNLVQHLLEKEYFVKGLIRDISSYKGPLSPHLEWVVGDLFTDFTKALEKVDYVVHIAAITCQNMLYYSDYHIINVNATIQLFHAAAKCNVKSFVFISTANTIGYGSFEKPGNENNPIRAPFDHSFYARSKKEAEDYLLDHKHIIPTIIVNPTFMLGAYDTKPSSGRIIMHGWKKKVVLCPPGGKNFVHVEDVAEGIIKCFENSPKGNRYLIAGENLSYYNFFRKLNAIAKQKPLMIKIPRRILLVAGMFGEIVRSAGIKTNLSFVNMKILCINNYYSHQKSVKELGMKYRLVDAAISDALQYFSKVK